LTDVGVWPMTLELDDGTILQGAVEAETFFTSSYWWFPGGETAPVKWPIPPKSSPAGIYQGQFLVSLQEDWAPEGQSAQFQIRRSRCLRRGGVYGKPNVAAGLARLPSECPGARRCQPFQRHAAAQHQRHGGRQGLPRRLVDGGWQIVPVALPGEGQASIAFAKRP
jgi:prolyl oligopeptidase